MDWLVNYLQNKPDVIRYMVEHLLDHNGDGQVTSQEMMTSLQQQREDWIDGSAVFSSHDDHDATASPILSRSKKDVIYNLKMAVLEIIIIKKKKF